MMSQSFRGETKYRNKQSYLACHEFSLDAVPGLLAGPNDRPSFIDDPFHCLSPGESDKTVALDGVVVFAWRYRYGHNATVSLEVMSQVIWCDEGAQTSYE